MWVFRATVLLLAGLASSLALAWENHSLLAYRTFEKMAEVASASTVGVEPLDSFLRDEEYTLEALLAGQEAWARVNLENYPALPEALVFKADASRSVEARRLAFLMALRVAPDSRFALYTQSDPWNPSGGSELPLAAVSTQAARGASGLRFNALKPGDQASALSVLATATDEPELGLDARLWEDNGSDWGRRYGLGPQPFGDPARAEAAQAPFHMGFLHESRAVHWLAPFVTRTFPVLRQHQFATLAALAFRTGHAYWGWRFAGISVHYLQDLAEPYRASLAPGESTLKLLTAQTLSMAGIPGPKKALLALRGNRRRVLENYLDALLLQAAARQQPTALEKALQTQDKDKSYPEWNDRYLRDVVTRQASRAAPALAQALVATMPAAYVSDPDFDFASKESTMDLLADAAHREGPDRARLDARIAEWMENCGAHSRNSLRGIFRDSSPP